MKKKYKISLAVIAILALVLGMSYAYWIRIKTQQDKNIVSTNCFDITFEENKGSEINLEYEYPLTEEQGAALSPYKFKIKNTCTLNANYDLRLEKLNSSSYFDASKLRVKLNDNESFLLNSKEFFNSSTDDMNGYYTIYSGSLIPNEEISYDLRLWIDYNSSAPDNMIKYETKISVYSSLKKENKTITLHSNEGNLSTSQYDIILNQKIGELPTPSAPEGKAFIGWYSDENLTNLVTSDTFVNEELTDLYAAYGEPTSTYKYWKYGSHAMGSAPNNVSDDYSQFIINDLSASFFYRTLYLNNNPTRHEVCAYTLDKLFCIEYQYFMNNGNENSLVMEALATKIHNELGANSNCSNNSSSIYCSLTNVSNTFNIYINVYQNGQVVIYGYGGSPSAGVSINSSGVAGLFSY